MAMMAITTSNSINVNPRLLPIRLLLVENWEYWANNFAERLFCTHQALGRFTMEGWWNKVIVRSLEICQELASASLAIGYGIFEGGINPHGIALNRIAIVIPRAHS
jgi:hypothetical protein